MNRKNRILAFLLLVASSLGGCTDNDDASFDSGTLLVRGNGGDPGSLDPALADDIHAFNILQDLYEGLVALSADGTLVPGVAESWSISADGLTYSFELRDNALWSDGEPVTAQHFVDAYQRATAPTSTSAYAFLLEPILEYVAVNASVLEIRLIEPAPHLLSVLALPIAAPVKSDEPGALVNPETLVGNGAYVLESHKVREATRLRRNARYWDAANVAIEEIVYLPIVDAVTEFNMYRTGELHITNTIPPTRVRDLRLKIPEEVRIAPALALYYLAFDLTDPPMDNVLLRQALTMAVNREQLVDIIGRGEQPAFGIVPEGVAGHEGRQFPWRDMSSEDRANQARALLEQAGYGPENPLSLKYTYDVGDIHERIALAVTSMWRDVLGIDVTIEKREWQHFLDTRDRRSEWQIMRFAWFGDYDHATTFTNIFRSGDPQNLPRYSNAEYDELLSAASRETDSAQQAAMLRDAEYLLLGEYPVAPLYFFVGKHLVNPRIRGFENNVLDRHPSKYLSIGGR